MDIIESFYASRNEENAVPMSAYMKNKFPFLGIKKPDRAKLSKEFLKQRKKDQIIDWDFIFRCYGLPEREFHYLAIGYLYTVRNLLKTMDTEYIEKLIITNSWWDTVDSIDEIVGHMCLKFPELKNTVITQWIQSENIWLKRVAIDFQLQYKEKTDVEVLSRAILSNKDTKEFFVNKAIGWALREYSKTNKEWVRAFLAENCLSALSTREAGKYL